MLKFKTSNRGIVNQKNEKKRKEKNEKKRLLKIIRVIKKTAIFNRKRKQIKK